MINLHMRPKDAPMSWADFCGTAPPFSIALDGYVHGGPQFDPTGPRLNVNHHEGVDRLATRATCAQVHIAIRQGLFDCFRKDGEATAEVFVNDSDQDVCLSWYLLNYHYRAVPVMNAALNRLVGMEDILDATAGAYPYPIDLPILREMAWIFEPYTRARAFGALDTRDAGIFAGVVEDVCNRVDRHLLGNGGQLPLDTRYEVLKVPHEGHFTVVREVGTHARTGMFAEGIRAFVSVREREDGRWNYVLGRMSRFIPFDVPGILADLNEAEGITGADRWGGADTIGGSPRNAGSALDPQTVAAIAARRSKE